MGIDWGFAGQVGGDGFGMVFMLLIILAIVIWLVGLVVGKISNQGEINDTKKGD